MNSNPKTEHEPTILERALDRIDYVRLKLSNHTVDSNGCWLYQGELNEGGYGAFTIHNKWATPQKRKLRAHRVAFAIHNNVDPGELFVRHKCDNPQCINPDHLCLGTPAANSMDMVSRGRSMQQLGAKNHNAKISEGVVRGIITKITEGQSNSQISKVTGVSDQVISRIRRGKAWLHVANDMEYEPKPMYKRRK